MRREGHVSGFDCNLLRAHAHNDTIVATSEPNHFPAGAIKVGPRPQPAQHDRRTRHDPWNGRRLDSAAFVLGHWEEVVRPKGKYLRANTNKYATGGAGPDHDAVAVVEGGAGAEPADQHSSAAWCPAP